MSITSQIANLCICNYLLFLNPTIIFAIFFTIISSAVKSVYAFRILPSIISNEADLYLLTWKGIFNILSEKRQVIN